MKPGGPLFSFSVAVASALLASPAAGQSTPAQKLAAAVRTAVTPRGLEKHTRAIVRYQRPSGSTGENAAIDHIVATLRADGVPVEVYTFLAYTSDPVSARVEVLGTNLSPEAITLSFSAAVQGLEAPLVDMGSLRDLPELEVGTGERLVLPGDLKGSGASQKYDDVKGAIALVEGQPRNVPVAVLDRLGAVGVIFMNPEERLNDLIVTSTWGNPSLRNAHRIPDLPVAQVTKSAGEAIRGLLAQGPTRVRLTTEVNTSWKPLRLAVARIPAPEPDAPYVLFGGHIDAWYHGGTDEGASNAAMVELARAFYKNRNQLRRALVVAWWPGHSNGRYAGSTWFADHFFDELKKRGVAYLNVDGIGQMGAKRFGANTTSSLAALSSRVVQQRTGEEIHPTRPGRNSDQAFNGIGLPLLQLNHTRLEEDGGYWWWHTPEDNIDKVDFHVLKTDTDLYADALAELLAAPALPVDAVAEVTALGEVIAQREAAANGRFELQEAAHRQEQLLSLIKQIQAILPRHTGAATDLALVKILRPLHRVLYSPMDPYHPDPGVELGLLPGFAPVKILATESPGSDLFRLAETTLIRERNRLLEALDQGIEEAEELKLRLERQGETALYPVLRGSGDGTMDSADHDRRSVTVRFPGCVLSIPRITPSRRCKG